MGMAPESTEVKGGTFMNTANMPSGSDRLTTNSTSECQGNGSDLITIDASLLLALQLPKDRIFILETERMITMFVQNQLMTKTEIEPINSYYRLLVHRVARFYGLEHVLDAQRSTVMILSKTPETQIPIVRLFELVERVAPAVQPQPPKILRRNPEEAAPAMAPMQTQAPADQKPVQKSVEEREAAYSKARAKIFEGFKPSEEGGPSVGNDVPQVIEPPVQQAPREKVLFKGWNLAAPEFEPGMAPLPAAPLPRPIYTKPVINLETIPVPQHILLLQVGTPDALRAFVARAGEALGATWEIRTKPGHCDALMLCQSPRQAQAILEGAAVQAVEGVVAKPWKPKFFPEP